MRAVEDDLVCFAIDRELPPMTPAQWARVLEARRVAGRVLDYDEAMSAIEAEDAR